MDLFFLDGLMKDHISAEEDWEIGKKDDRKTCLICVDVYSRYISLEYIGSKQSDIVAEKVKEFIEKIKDEKEKKSVIVSDRGKEFSKLKNIENVKHVYTRSQFGASLAESHIGRMKRVLLELVNIWKGMYPHDYDPYDMVELLPHIEDILNNRFMNSIGCIPKDVINEKCTPVNKKIKECEENPEEDDLPIHTPVIIPNVEKTNKNAFMKRSITNDRSQMMYQVVNKRFFNCRWQYKVRHILNGDEADFWFYRNELMIIPKELINDMFDYMNNMFYADHK